MYKQRKLNEATVRDYCVSEGIIPKHYHQRDFCTFDIESIGQDLPSDVSVERTSQIVNLQRVVSVSVSKSFGDRSTKVLTRKSMSENDYHEFIRLFMTHLLELSLELYNEIPQFIRQKIDSLKQALQEFKNKERNYSNKQIKEMKKALNYLNNMTRLKCFGYNSGKYDLPCLFPGLLAYSDKHNVKFSIIKRGNSILSLTMQDIIFVDVCNFTSGCSLDAFNRMWGAETTKAIFPYEKFDSIKSLECCKIWPPMRDFKSSLGKKKFRHTLTEIKSFLQIIRTQMSLTEDQLLKQLDPNGDLTTIGELENCDFPVKLDSYISIWLFYNENCRKGTMESMMDYLRYYNSLDTISLVQSFEKYVDSFIENFDCNPIDFCTLPGLAEQVMWSKFNSSKFAAYTVGESFGHINKLIRENLMGGLSCVFARHIEVGPSAENFDGVVTTAKNGEKFSQIVAVDANSKFK